MQDEAASGSLKTDRMQDGAAPGSLKNDDLKAEVATEKKMMDASQIEERNEGETSNKRDVGQTKVHGRHSGRSEQLGLSARPRPASRGRR